ncbi:hypothetical protein [Pseudomonas moorei]|uniref:Uncharacterized protein n=1 Tax=Pseudomonas moorei TaxID=395599 RepID=A0A1H1CSN5_9PSED|nr:hypothetical protein [Pseudomonas moorei]KAB0504681.1 PTS sugar transporter subunit IIC [Pseudomonas moorei]SDQ67192.1 hypothetical protein SAMN04490195_1365 [Pseudomonas moorei]
MDGPNEELHELNFYIQRNIRYHMRRAAFFLYWGRVTAFIGVIFGSATVTSLLASSPPWVTGGAALIVTLASATDLVAGTADRAWLHNDLRKRYLEIEAEMIAENTETQLSKVRQYRSEIRRIEADEPPTLPALELLAMNDVIRSMYPKEKAEKLVSNLPWIKRVSAQWFHWDTSKA